MRIARFSLVFIGFLVAILYWIAPPIPSQTISPEVQVFEQVWQTINENFFDPEFNGTDWNSLREVYAPQAASAKSQQELAAVINQMLSQLNASHTHYYTPLETEYYQLAGIFWDGIQEDLAPLLPEGKLKYTGIGIYTREIDHKTFIRAILDSSPAAAAGLKVGDQILEVDGNPFQPVQSFAGKADQAVEVQIQRSPNSSPETLTVTPKVFDPTTMFLDALKESVDVIERDGHKIGYVHVWSYADPMYQNQFELELATNLYDIDGLIWDLRDGWGGANLSYLNPFTAPTPTALFINREGEQRIISTQWQKPVVMLVNEGSRSGKEMLAYAFRKYEVGQIVGSKTAGAVLGGRAYIMDDGSLLYVAVVDVLVDGTRLEGVGITPDVEVPFSVAYAQGADPQKEQAIETALEMLRSGTRSRSSDELPLSQN